MGPSSSLGSAAAVAMEQKRLEIAAPDACLLTGCKHSLRAEVRFIAFAEARGSDR